METSEVELPESVENFFSVFNTSSFKQIWKLCQNPTNLSLEQSLTWHYSGQALLAGRPLNTAMIFLAGKTGAGKSTTINVLFDDSQLCPTSESRSVTKEPTIIRKKVFVPQDNTNTSIAGFLSFIDVPGTFDTDRKNEARNLASIQKFKKSRIELLNRCAPTSEEAAQLILLRKYLNITIRKDVFPNLVLFVVDASDKRTSGDDSDLHKSLEVLKKCGGLVDLEHHNLIIILTNAISLGRRPDKFTSSLKERCGVIRDAVAVVFQIFDVDIVPVENDPFDANLAKVGDFFQLPNGDLSHQNLINAMMKLFEVNEDRLGLLMVGRYFSKNCLEKSNKAEVIQSHVELEENDLTLAAKVLQKLKMSIPDNFERIYNFQILGHGFDPVTEETKPMSLVADIRGGDEVARNMIEIGTAKFSVPTCISHIQEETSRFRKVSFYEKETYQRNMQRAYGIDADFKLIVSANSSGRWVNSATGIYGSSLVRMAQDIQIATFRLEDPIKNVNCQNFLHELRYLPESYTNETATVFRAFFSRWGTHVVYEVAMGGTIQYNCTIDGAALNEKRLTEIEAKVSPIFSLLNVSGGVSGSVQSPDLRHLGVTNVDMQIRGGNPPSFPFLQMPRENLQDWSNTVPDDPTELAGSIKLYPYYNFLGSGPRFYSLWLATSEYLEGTLSSRIQNVMTQTRNQISKEAVAAAARSDSGPNCFPKGTLVYLSYAQERPIQDLLDGISMTTISLTKESFRGDHMKPGKRSTTTFCTFLDKQSDKWLEYLVMQFSNGKKLIVSEGHMIFQFHPGTGLVRGKQAKNFEVGEMTLYSDGMNSSIETPEITKIFREMHEGAYSPLTMSGTFFADGFLASSYAHTDSFSVAQAGLLPLKMWCKMFKKSDSETAEIQNGITKFNEGIHPFAKFLMNSRKCFTSLNPLHKN